MASAKFKHAVKRIKDKLGTDYTPAEAVRTAGPVGSGKLFINSQIFDGDISGVTQVVNVGRPAAAQYAAKVGGGVTVSSSGGGSTTTTSGGTGAAITSSFVIANPDALLTNARLLAVSTALSLTDAGSGGNITIGMATPPTLSATSTNDAATGSHAITASAAPGAAESLLKSTSAGLLTLPQFTASTKVTTPLIDTASGVNLSLTPASGVTVITGRATIVSDTEGSGSGNQTYQLSVSKSGSGSLQLGTHSGYPAISGQGSGSSYRLLLNPENGGNVGVGMTDPTYKLDVTGTMRATTSLTTPLITTATNVDLVINPAGTGAVQFPNDQTLRTSDFDSSFPIEGWQINEVAGISGYSALTIGKIQADELAVRVFVADEVRVDRGDEFWTKSYGIVAESFTTPGSVGGTVSVIFEDSPALAGAIFTNNDWVLIRKLDIDTGITLSSIWGQVATYVNNSDGTQSWTFTLRTSHTAIDVTKGSLAIDFGASGAALIHLSVIDAAGAPYIKMRKWAGANPYTPSNFTTYVQLGELGSTGNAYVTPAGYGLYVRSTGDDSRFLLADDNGLQIRGASFKMYDGAAQTVDISSTDGSMKLGTDVSSGATTAFDFDAATGDLTITGDLYTDKVYLLRASGLNTEQDVWGSWDNRRAMQWWPSLSSMSGDPSLSMYTGKHSGGSFPNQNWAYIDSNPTGGVLANLSITAHGQGTADDASIYIEGGSQSLASPATVVITAENIDLSGNVDTASLSVGGTAVSLDGHTHSYLPLSGGTLTGTLITDIMRPATNNTKTVGTASHYYNAGYFDSLYVNTIVGTPSYSHTHSASEITSGTLDFARIPTTWNGALTLDADTGLTSNYVRWTTQTATGKAWDMIGRAHDYATTPAQQNDLLLTYYDGSSTYTVWQADSGTRVVDFLNTPTVGGTALVPGGRTVSAGSGLTGGGALSGNITISHDDTSTQASINNSGTTFIQDVTLDTYGHVTALGSVDMGTALDSRYVNVDSDTMTGMLTITNASSDEQLRLDALLATGNPYLTFYQNGTRRSYIQHFDTSDVLIIADEYGAISLRPGSAGTPAEKLQVHTTGATVTGSLTASTSVVTPTVTTSSGNLSLTSVGGTVAVTGALTASSTVAVTTSVSTPSLITASGNLSINPAGGTTAITGALTGSSTAAFTTSVSTPTVTTASGNLTLTSTGGTVAVTGALTGSSTGVFTSTLTAASDTDAINTFGRVRLGYAAATDTASFSHFDQNTSTNFALSQSAAGATIVNAASGQTLSLSNAGSATTTISASGIDLQNGKYIGSSDYASLTTGWRIDQYGGGDFRTLNADQLHVKSFIADLEQALAGGQIISKSVAVISTDFVVPYAGGTQRLYVEDLPSAANMAVFETNDYIRLRTMSRAAGALTVGNVWGQVSGYTDYSDGTQSWLFTRSGSTTYNTITMRGTAQSSASSGATSRSVTKPSGVTSGDVLLAIVTHDGSPDVITATGWTELGYSSGTDINAGVYYKVAGGSEGANYTFSTVSSHAIAASVVAYYNVSGTYPIDGFAIVANVAGSTLFSEYAWCSSSSGQAVFFGGISNNTSATPPSGMTEQIDAGATGIRVYVADKGGVTSGSAGFNATISSSSYTSVGAVVILRPTYSAMSTEAGGIVPGATIDADSLALDYGITGNGIYEVTTVDGTYGANSPYAQVATWTTHPSTGQVVRTRMGNLTGISGASAGEYGLYAGSGTIAATSQYLRVSTSGVQMNNVPIVVSSGGTEALRVTPSEGIRIQAGSSVQNQIDVYSSSDKVYAQWTQLDAVYSNTETQFISYGKTGLGMGTLTLKSQSADGVDSAYIAIGSTYINIVGKPLTVFNGATINSGLALSSGDLDMNSNDIIDIGQMAIGSSSLSGKLSITATTDMASLYISASAASSVGNISIASANLGNTFGPWINVGRNTYGSGTRAGWIRLTRKDGVGGDLWVDASGNLRIGADTTSASDTGGTVVGTQTSSLDSKHIIEPFIDYTIALTAIVDAPLYDFTYKSGAFNGQRFTGIVTDYAPIFGMDRDEAHPAGKSLNTISAHGYTFAAIKALHTRVEQLESQVRTLTHAD